ncbi:MAG: sulfatase, partial [Planctomycetota bacterium]|nr:sulfatase [Planctomycetota bacterium]
LKTLNLSFKKDGVMFLLSIFITAFIISLAGVSDAGEPNRPNIRWIYVEDMNDWMGCYGDKIIKTPAIDSLAAKGVRFDRAYMPAGVCSATRSALITGTMQTTFGIHNHRSSRDNSAGRFPSLGMIRLPEGVLTVPELFRKAGYYTYNQGKDDYNFVYKRERLYSNKNDWRGRKSGQPFFAQIQLRGGKNRPVKTVDPAKVPIPPYYPDTSITRREIAHHYDCVLKTDQEVASIISRLKKDGLFESTVIFFFTDHGMRLLRHKQFVYEEGVRVPLIVHWPGEKNPVAAGTVRKDLVSGIDISVTSLALAGIKIPAHMEGRNVFAPQYKPRSFVISARDRCDYTIEHIRTVRTDRFRYLKNFLTDRPWMQPQYRDARPHTKEMKKLFAEGKLNPVQARFMGPKKPAEELYDHSADPHEINNLASNPEYSKILQAHRKILSDWMAATDDKGQDPEAEEGLAQVYFRWKDTCVNPEYEPVRKKYSATLAEITAAARAKADAKRKRLIQERKKRRLEKKGEN